MSVLSFILSQVETVGDKYMAVSGLPEPCASHARCMARVALDMMDIIKDLRIDGKPVVRKINFYLSRKKLLVRLLCIILNYFFSNFNNHYQFHITSN